MCSPTHGSAWHRIHGFCGGLLSFLAAIPPVLFLAVCTTRLFGADDPHALLEGPELPSPGMLCVAALAWIARWCTASCSLRSMSARPSTTSPSGAVLVASSS